MSDPQTPVGSDLEGVKAEYGIPDEPAAIGSSDFKVILKRRKGGDDQTMLASEVLKTFYSRTPAELRELKRRLHAAGFYPKGTTLAEIDHADYDDESLSAFENAVTRAGAFKEAGVRKTLGQVLDTPSERLLSGSDGSEAIPPAIKQKIVQAAAQELLGRDVSDVEAAQISSRIQTPRADEAQALAEQAIASGPYGQEAKVFKGTGVLDTFYESLNAPVDVDVVGPAI